MALPFSEWTREAKDEFAKKRMDEMRFKNEQLKLRHAEVEQDRITAEAKNSAVTSLKISKKENTDVEMENVPDIPKPIVEREWDRGKINQDADDWSPPKFHGYHSRAPRRNFPDRRSPKKEENWRVRSANTSKDRQSYFSKFRPSGPNYKYQESSNQGTSGFRNDTGSSFSRQSGSGYRMSSGTYRSFQNSRRLEEPKKKSVSGGGGSASPSLSDSEVQPIKHPVKIEHDRMWQDGGITEVQHKQSRVEKWVKSINTATSWNAANDKVKDFNEKGGEGGTRETTKNFSYSNDDSYSKKAHAPRGQGHLKNRERYEDAKYAQSSRRNVRGQGTRFPADDRAGSVFDNKNQRDIRKKGFGDKNRLRRESDLSDRTSSMKESDSYDYGKDKFTKTASDSKSSDYSGILDNEDGECKYPLEKRQFERQSEAHNYSKDKFNKSRNLRSSNNSGDQDGPRKDDFSNEHSKNIRQKFPNNFTKDRPKSSTLRNSDYGSYDDQYSEGRSGFRKSDNYSHGKNKFNKFKGESKFGGSSEKFEVLDTRTSSHKYKSVKRLPKRVKHDTSVDTSSTASKTVEFHSNEEEKFGNIKNTGLNWCIEPDDESGLVDNQNNAVDNEAELNKTSIPEDCDTSLKSDCTISTEKVLSKNLESENEEKNYEDIVPEQVFYCKDFVKIDQISLEGEGIKDLSNNDFACLAITNKENTDSGNLVLANAMNYECGADSVEPCICQNEMDQMIQLGVEETDLNIVTNTQSSECNNDKVPSFGCQNDVRSKTELSTLSTDEISVDADNNENKQIPTCAVSCEVEEFPNEIEGNEHKHFSDLETEFEVQKLLDEAVQLTEKNLSIIDAGHKHTNIDEDVLFLDTDSELSPEKPSGFKDSSSPSKKKSHVSSEQSIENEKKGNSVKKVLFSSSPNIGDSYEKDKSESILPSSKMLANESNSCKRSVELPSSTDGEGRNDYTSNLGALNLSDDGGWSTVSEDENNTVSDNGKNNKQ